MQKIDDPLLGTLEIQDMPEKVTMKDLWVETQKIKWTIKGTYVRLKIHEIGLAATWAVILVVLGML